ncbi:MAG: tRNA (adenosine(37)-N6)-threonylcarbamoyltransferase complex transferase subunit TsaD [Candidatus Kaiserbacteria bacterium]|nr:tRNA (adenosine(37)-N6)-threonylcarbamoyltransferase complex transferase subunit TsaD [Candidatus Kaiserbacteria bacterium]
MRILAIETSCDETAVALLAFTEKSDATHYRILAEKLYSQSDLHSAYGGVYPSLAKREHQKILPILTKELLAEQSLLQKDPSVQITNTIEHVCVRGPAMLAAIKHHFSETRPTTIDALAVTHGPGLAPALWVGVNFVRVLSLLWDIPIIAVNHMEGHIVSALITDTALITPRYPILALLVSGGHTELVLAQQPGSYQKIGQTLDDAAGEAFDKIARLLGLPYPGGPAVARLAKWAREQHLTAPVTLPRPMLRDNTLDFSYAGLKTAVRVFCEKHPNLTDSEKAALAMECEDAIVETLLKKTQRALEQHHPHSIIVGGGVSANNHLREAFRALVAQYPNTTLHLAHRAHATDNAVMIALTAYSNRTTVDSETLAADANLSFPCGAHE